MKKTFDQYQGLLFCAACVAVVIVGGLYYFGIVHAFVPNGEDLSSTQLWYLILTNRQSYSHNNIIYDIVMCLAGLIGGMSYFACRLTFAFLYMIVLGLSLSLSVTGKKKRKPWHLLPLWALFMIFVHTIQGGSTFGRVYDDTDLIWQLPYNYHIMPLIFMLVSLGMLQCYLGKNKGGKKNVVGGLGIIVVVYGLLFTDLIYYIIFAFPLIIVLSLRGIYNDKTRKYMMPLLVFGFGVIMLSRILPENLFGKLWSDEAVRHPYGAIYGGTNWLNLDNVTLHVTNYIKTIMLLFNIDLSDYPMISLYSVLFVVRIAFVVIGYAMVVKIIACSVKGNVEKNGYSMIDEILAWGFVTLSCAFIFTKNALERDLIRYYAAFVPILTILLCRNIGSFMRTFLPVLESIKYKKFFFAGIVGAICICQVEPVWMYKAEDSYQEDCEAAIDYLRQWGVENDGYAVAPYWLYARLSAMTKGEILFYCDEKKVRQLYGEDASIRYMVVGWEHGVLSSHLEYIAYGSYDEMCEKYKAPVRAVDLDHFYVCEFNE